MVDVREVSPAPGNVLVMVGTTKGAFVYHAAEDRRTWQRGGPYFPGHAVYAVACDLRAGRKRLWAAPDSSHWGATLQWSDDFGQSWTETGDGTLRFPEDTAASLVRIWQIAIAPGDAGRTMFCGVEPAALFRSDDGGGRFELVRGLWENPHRPRWEPGGGGLCLHTILPDPTRKERMHVAISTGGVYRTDDDGATWRTAHRGVRADFLPDKHPEFGQCVHKVVHHPSAPEVFFLQNHWGLYRSDDAGDSWRDIANGVPSDFGFAMAVHPREAETVYIVPLESDQFRCTPESRLRVFRTRDGGASWEGSEKGLPQEDAFETVLRDALCTDPLSPAGVYFGTRSGSVYASADDGDSWTRLAESLPPVLCVRAAVVPAAS